MTKILFSNLPWWESDNLGHVRRGIRAGSRWPFTRAAEFAPDEYRYGGYLPYPFFMGHAAAYAKRQFPDAAVWLRDSVARGESYETFFAHLEAEQPEWIVMETATPCLKHDLGVIREIKLLLPHTKIILTGTIVADRDFELPEGIHAAVRGEYEKGVVKVINGADGIVDFDLLTKEEMDALPFPLTDPECEGRYWDACPVMPPQLGHQWPHLQIWTSRGCPYKCLAGDTPVNTVEGLIPIRDLVGREGLGVFTYDFKERRAKVSTARNIMKLGHEKLVRVHYDDHTHVDLTPDHRVMTFTTGNQFSEEKEFEVEAQHLLSGMRVRAIKEYKNKKGYSIMAWGRRDRTGKHRMVAEWKYGRRLNPGELVHHADRNPSNNHPNNLEIKMGQRSHFADHPEIAQRMRENNPTKNGISPEWAAKLAAANRGKIRTLEARERYRLAAIKREAAKSPEQKRIDKDRMLAAFQDKKPWLKRARNATGQYVDGIPNHRVVFVEELPGEHDVYCLEVPETGWFYANNVIHRNCCFCGWPATMTGNDPDGDKARSVRCHSPEWLEAMIEDALMRGRMKGINYRSIYLDDDTANLTNAHTLNVCAVMKRIGLPWSAMCRADTIRPETWKAMKDAGCFGVKVGCESGSQNVIDTIVNKRLNLRDVEFKWLPLLKELGFNVHTTWTEGLPGETEQQRDLTRAMIARLYEKGLHKTHQLSGTAEISGTPLHTLRVKGDLAKYPGAHVAEGYELSHDGQRKVEEMER